MKKVKLSLFVFANIFASILFPEYGVSEPIVFKIGASLPLSGDLSYVGQDILRGFEIARRDFNSNEFKFEIIAEDDGYYGKNAATAAMKLINVDHVDAVISLWDMAEVIAPIAESKKIPHFSIRWNPAVTEKYNYTMTIESTYKSWIESLVELLKELKTRNVSIIHEEAVGWNLGSEHLIGLLKEHDIKLLSHRIYLRSDTDYRSILSKALRDRPDFILLLSNPPFVEGFLKIIRSVNPAQKTTGYYEIVNDLSLIEGLPFVAQLEASLWFVEKLDKQYKTRVVTRSPQSYDILSIINSAHKESNYKRSLKGDEIVKFVRELKDFEGASGKINSRGTRVIEMDCAWKIVRGGEIEKFYP
ncbi:MAG TPA: ABC transporter substrate-binding protein [Oligoflexia bacterium]|nr:ABC transporter substrate-binding protein [Oligoflexia bacterium]HMP48941.1 ABC transporter substrate-binding protein [Oligoflexia bacterium]